jgi:hypothetical protein
MALGSSARAGEVIDRIVVIVNGHVVLQSDWDDAVCFEAFSEGRPLGQISQEQRAATLERLVDQELLREQVSSEEHETVPVEEVRQKIQEVRSQHPEAATDSGWHALLAGYGLTEPKLEARLSQQLSALHQIDVRLRPTVQVDAASIEAYYKNTFLPQMHKAGAADVPLAQVSARIREILIQEKINELLTSWMQALRRESKIHSNVALPHPIESAGGASQ